GDAASEGPEAVLDAVGQLHDLFGDFEFEGHVRAVVAVDGRGGVGSVPDDAGYDRQFVDGDLVFCIATQCAFRPQADDAEVVNVVAWCCDRGDLLQGCVAGARCRRLCACPPAEGESYGQRDEDGRGTDDDSTTEVACCLAHRCSSSCFE